MRDIDGGGGEPPVQLEEFDPRLDAQLGVQIGQRFVEQEYARIPHDGASDRHALPLASGELAGVAFEKVGDGEDVRRPLHAAYNFLLGSFPHPQAKGHVLVDGHMRVERVVLEHHRDIAIPREDIVQEAAIEIDLPPRDFFQAGDHPERGGLAASGRAQEHDELAVVDGK